MGFWGRNEARPPGVSCNFLILMAIGATFADRFDSVGVREEVADNGEIVK
jgi:hypothetical protein